MTLAYYSHRYRDADPAVQAANLARAQEARHRWAPAMQNLRPLLVVYLAREVWPGKGEP